MSVNERVKIIRKELKLTQEDFADRINVSRGNLANIEISRVAVTDRVISDICRCFQVSEVWLRTGEGEQYAESPAEDRFLAKIGDYASDGTDPRKKIILAHIMEIMDGIPDDYLEKVADIIIDAAAELQKLKSEE